ncbi:hypothetical protein ACQ4PT_015049 [Festuca glaucescens]
MREPTPPGPATGSSGQEFVGGVGRVGGQGSAATDGDGGLKMGTHAGGGKGTQCKNMKQNQRKKLNGSSLIKEKCQKVVKSQDKQLPDYRGRNTKPASAGLRSPKLTSSPGVNFLVRSAAAKRANMAGSPKTPQPPSCSQIGSPSLQDLSPDTAAANSHGEVKNNMEKLFNEYNKEVESQRDSGTQEVEDDNDPLAEWDQYMKSKRQQSSNELDQYLKEQLTSRKEKVDMLHWWKTKSEIYPVLSKIARDVLAIPASTVPSESAFSTGGPVISDYRSSLAPTTVESLICLQDWFKAADARKNE